MTDTGAKYIARFWQWAKDNREFVKVTIEPGYRLRTYIRIAFDLGTLRSFTHEYKSECADGGLHVRLCENCVKVDLADLFGDIDEEELTMAELWAARPEGIEKYGRYVE